MKINMICRLSHCITELRSTNPPLKLALMLSVAFSSLAIAQRSGTDSAFDAIDLYSNRTLSRGIERARDRIASGEYSQAIRFLDEVLADEQDSFVAVSGANAYAGLKRTANSLIRELPPDGMELYQSMFGPLARKRLREASAAGNFDDVRSVVRRYFYTSAGLEAALLLAQHHADVGQHRSAALLYQRLLDTPRAVEILDPQLSLLAAQSWLALGEQRRASELLSKLVASQGKQGLRVMIAGQEHKISGEPLQWYADEVGMPRQIDKSLEKEWLVAGGNTARNGRSKGGLPHTRVRWQARLLNRPQFEEVYAEIVDSLDQRQKPLLTAGTPLAIGNTIIASTAHNVVAFDFQTGKRIWQTEPQRVSEFDQLLSLGDEHSQIDSNVELAQLFARRIWNDYLYNSLSSDGQRVFVIRDLTLANLAEPAIWAIPIRGGGLPGDSTHAANRLCAYELTTQGKLVWEIDGAARKDELASAFFLGTPISVDDHLYCLAEIKSSIHLVALDPETGRLDWLQQLADLHTGIPLDPQRRLQGAVPSYEAGILVCPTGAGVVLGIDLDKHEIAWHFSYESNHAESQYHRLSRGQSTGEPSEWLDGRLILAEGCALLSPPETDSLYCLDLVTGKLLWELPREDGIFVAGVDQGRVLIIGNQSYSAVSLKNGESVWRQAKVSLPSGVTPNGRGFFSSQKYFLPLSNAQVIAIDLQSGEIVERAVARSGSTMGNLISHRGAILSQDGRFLDCFDQIDVLRGTTEEKLAKNPADFDALRTIGEIAYTEGRLGSARITRPGKFPLTSRSSHSRDSR